MRVLVTGAQGQLGREVVAAFEGHEVIGLDLPETDVGDRGAVLLAVAQAAPDAIVHAAAWTDVDGCEADPGRALRINALGTRHVVEAARQIGARICYVSTDYVFDGRAGRPYDEWDTTNPLSAYGRSKLGGEQEVGDGHTIVRTAWLCGRFGSNFVKSVLARAAAGEPLRVVDDQHGCPTFADDLASMIRLLVVEHRTGLYHVTNQGVASWYEFACAVVSAAGGDPSIIEPISTTQLDPPRLAPRPPYSLLENAALRLSGLPLLPDYGDSLRRLVAQLL